MPKNEKKPRGERKPWAAFFIAFAVSFVLLMCIFLVFFIVGTSKDREANAVKGGVPYYSNYQATEQENLNMLIIGCDKTESEPTMILFVSYNAIDSVLEFKPIDPLQFVSYKDRVDTIAGHYAYQGITGGVNAAEILLGNTIDKFVRITSVGIANLVDYLGGVQYEFKESISCKAISFTAGKQTLDGRRVAAILLDSANSEVKQAIIEGYFAEHFNASLGDNFGKYVTAFFYNAETNLNQYDFAIRQKGLLSAMYKSTLRIEFEK